MNRRGFIGAMLAAGAAPYIVRSGILMPVKKLWTPEIPQAYAYLNGRLWLLTNSGVVNMTVIGMEVGEEKTATPRPIDLSPGESLAFQPDIKLFSKWESKYSAIIDTWPEVKRANP